MRYYIGSCEYKWSHAKTSMEQMWVMRELGTDLYKLIEQQNWEWKLIRSNSQTLPDDVYCRCDIYVDVPSSKQATMFVLKYPQAVLVEKVIE
jgi:hypothetical protein